MLAPASALFIVQIMNSSAYLALAIAAEIVATSAVKASDGLARFGLLALATTG